MPAPPRSNKLSVKVEFVDGQVPAHHARVALLGNAAHRVVNPGRGQTATFHGLPAGATRAVVTVQGVRMANQEVTIPASGSADVTVKAVKPIRVLVTGFHDWKTATEPWKCKENPSGQLLLGPNFKGKSHPVTADHVGPLIQACADRAVKRSVPVEWSFDTLVVAWGTGNSIPWRDHDVVISLGLGVYGGKTNLQIEMKPRNNRVGSDVYGHSPPADTIDPGEPKDHKISVPANIAAVIRQIAYGPIGPPAPGVQPANITLNEAHKDTQYYICNETFYLGLQAMTKRVSPARPQAVVLIHLPELTAVSLNDLAPRVADSLIEFLVGLRSAGILK